MLPTLEITVNQKTIQLLTKSGVFSSKGLDDGTRLLLEKVEVKNNTLIADLASGSGVIGFYAAMLNTNGHVHLLEDHLRSFNLAKENIEYTRLTNVEAYLSDLFSAVENRSYHQIISNPPQQLGNEFLEELVLDCFNHLKSQGELWLVIKDNVKPFLERILDKIFKNCTIIAHGKGYVVLKSIKN